MNRQRNIFRNKKGNNSNRSISAIGFSLVAFIFGPVISLFLVFGITTILNMKLGLNELITTTPYNMIISMLGYPIILYLLIIINSKLYDGDLSKFGFSSKRKYVIKLYSSLDYFCNRIPNTFLMTTQLTQT